MVGNGTVRGRRTSTPVVLDGQGEKKPDSFKAGDWTMSVEVVGTVDSGEALPGVETLGSIN